jgi:hypothetical protein
MTVRYSFTFEFDTQPPLTHTGTVSAGRTPTCFVRAVKEAMRAYPGRAWTSCVCVLLERVDDEPGEVTETAEAAEVAETVSDSA